MKSVLTEQVYAIYIDAVRTPQLTVEHVDFFCDHYSTVAVFPSKLTTKEINKILMLLKLIGINNAPLRGELCICLILIKMWTTSDSCNVNVPVHENCDALYSHYNPIKFGSGKKSIPEDKFFSKFCYYLRVAVEVVQVKNLQRFIVENILVPLSGAIGVEYITGTRESDQTGIRYQALGMESGIYRPKDILKVFASEVSHSMKGYTSSAVLQESCLSEQPKKPMKTKRTRDETVSSLSDVVVADIITLKKARPDKLAQVSLITLENNYNASDTVVPRWSEDITWSELNAFVGIAVPLLPNDNTAFDILDTDTVVLENNMVVSNKYRNDDHCFDDSESEGEKEEEGEYDTSDLGIFQGEKDWIDLL